MPGSGASSPARTIRHPCRCTTALTSFSPLPPKPDYQLSSRVSLSTMRGDSVGTRRKFKVGWQALPLVIGFGRGGYPGNKILTGFTKFWTVGSDLPLSSATRPGSVRHWESAGRSRCWWDSHAMIEMCRHSLPCYAVKWL